MKMIGTRLRSAALVAGMMSSALAFYMVSLRVSAERSAVAQLERQIASNLMSIRQLNSELGTRERLPQIEKWNADVLALSSPKPHQYLDGAVELAAFATDRQPAMNAQLRQAVLQSEQRPATTADVVQAVSYAAAAAPQAERPVVTFSTAEDAVERPLLREATHRPVQAPAQAPAQVVRVSASPAMILSDSVIAEIRDTAAAEAAGLRRATVR